MLVMGVAPGMVPPPAGTLPNGRGALGFTVPGLPTLPCPAMPGIGYAAAGGVAERIPDVGGALGSMLDPPLLAAPLLPPPGIKGCGGLDIPGAPLGAESLNVLPLPPNVGRPPLGGKVPGGGDDMGGDDIGGEDVGGGALEPGGKVPPGNEGIDGGCGA